MAPKEPLSHGPLCQCVGCRAERFAKRGVAAQVAVDALTKAPPAPPAKAKKKPPKKAPRKP